MCNGTRKSIEPMAEKVIGSYLGNLLISAVKSVISMIQSISDTLRPLHGIH